MIERQDVDTVTGLIELPGNGNAHWRQIVPFMIPEEVRVIHKPITHIGFKPVTGSPSSASVRSHRVTFNHTTRENRLFIACSRLTPKT